VLLMCPGFNANFNPTFTFNKHNMKKILLSAALAFVVSFAANAQETAKEQDAVVTENPAEIKEGKTLTAEELKAERAALVAMIKSEDFQKKLAKVDAAKPPKETGINGVDALSGVVTDLQKQMKENRSMVPQLYASVTGQTIDGAAATEIKPVSPEDLLAFSKMCVQMGNTLVKSSKDVVGLPAEIKSAGMMKGLKAVKSVSYIKNSIGVLKDEITYNSKMVNNLIATNKLNTNSMVAK
jgi:hypothetical protein